MALGRIARDHDDGHTKLNCQVSMGTMNADYSFRGACLVLKKNGEEHVFVPAN